MASAKMTNSVSRRGSSVLAMPRKLLAKGLSLSWRRAHRDRHLVKSPPTFSRSDHSAFNSPSRCEPTAQGSKVDSSLNPSNTLLRRAEPLIPNPSETSESSGPGSLANSDGRLEVTIGSVNDLLSGCPPSQAETPEPQAVSEMHDWHDWGAAVSQVSGGQTTPLFRKHSSSNCGSEEGGSIATCSHFNRPESSAGLQAPITTDTADDDSDDDGETFRALAAPGLEWLAKNPDATTSDTAEPDQSSISASQTPKPLSSCLSPPM